MNLVGKRVLDLVAAALGLVLLCPFLAAIAVAIRIDSPGPVFYRGVRTGQYFRPFRIYKFRTMVVNAEAMGSVTTSLHDPRTTTVGRFLRPHKLDELPQLINVLKGEMSLVGPRPEVEAYTRLYDDSERRILLVRPGITDPASLRYLDLAAIVGSESAEEVYRRDIFQRKNALRLQYAETWSLRGDLSILMATARALAHHSFSRPDRV